MTRDSKGTRLRLPVALANELLDFREAYFGAPEQRIVEEAIRLFMADRLLAEPAVRARFEAARDKRLAAQGKNVAVLRPGKG